MLADLIQQLHDRAPLTEEQIGDAVSALIDPEITPEQKAQFLTALAVKGETVEEIAGFARHLREKSIQPPIDPATRQEEIIDVCGMGGDRLNTFNISTTVGLIVASAGVYVAKHGNRAVTSQAGSADVLEALGVPIDLPPETAADRLRERHFAFFFAPQYHPTFKHIGPARKLCAAQGQRTIFNILGPLLNPARPSAQLVGVPNAALCEPIGRVLQSLGLRRAMVASGQVGEAWLDELSILGKNVIAEFYQDRGFTAGVTQFEGLLFQPCSLKDLGGSDRDSNAATVRQLLGGLERGPKRDAVLLNAAAALFVAGRTRTILEGWELGEELIDSGRAARKLAELTSP